MAQRTSKAARRVADLPVAAYGAPASTIDNNAIGFNGAYRPVTQLVNMGLTLEDENKLPRAERNKLREYKKANNIPQNAPAAAAAPAALAVPATTSSSASSSRTKPAGKGRALLLTPDLRRTARTTTSATLDHHLAAAEAAGQPIADLVPNANGAGAQRRDPFEGVHTLRVGAQDAAESSTAGATPYRVKATSAASSSRSGASRGVGLPAPGQSLQLDSERQRIHNFALRAPLDRSAATSEASSDGPRRAAAAAAAAADGTIVPDSDSFETLSERSRSRRTPGGTTDGDDSESGREGQKHTRRATPHKAHAAAGTGARALHLPPHDTPRATRYQKGKGRAGRDDEDGEGVELLPEWKDEAGDATIRGGPPSDGATRTPRRLASALKGERAVRRGASPVRSHHRASGACPSIAPLLVTVFFAFLAQLWLNSQAPVDLARKLGVSENLIAHLPASSALRPVYHQDATPAAAAALPPDLVRTAALDSVSRRLERLSTAQRKDKTALDKAVRELVSKFDGFVDQDMELLLKQLKMVTDRVDAVEGNVQELTRAMNAGGATHGADKRPDDVVTFADLRRYHADRTGREDLANPAAGARIVAELTTWDAWWGGRYGTRPKAGGWFGARLASSGVFNRAASDPYANNPNWALTQSTQPGHCWQFPAYTKGAPPSEPRTASLGIALARRTYVGAFSIEHVARELVPDRQSAPAEVELWGVVDPADGRAMETLAAWRTRMAAERATAEKEAEGAPANARNSEWDAWVAEEDGGRPQPVPPADNYVLLATLEYALGAGAPDVQVAEVRPSVRRLEVEFGTVQVRFRGNHGAENTCVYRVRVHPELVQ